MRRREKMVKYCVLFGLFLTVLIQTCFTLEEKESQELVARGFKRKLKTRDTCRGLPGLPGRDGRDGRDAGLRGPAGRQGPRGPRGFRGRTGKSGDMKAGSVYTRWGRKKCPNTRKTTQLYSGVMAGSHYTHMGGGSNYLCLPLNPTYERRAPGNQGSSYIYGTEYEYGSAQRRLFPKSNLHDHEPPCAVCHAQSRASHVMIPARTVCPSGWTMEYKGYLMTEHHGHKGRTQFICIDGNPEATFGSHVNKNGALLYFVEGHCGSLPCPPYVQGYELTCVVCTK